MSTHVVGAMAAILRKHRKRIPVQLVIDVADYFEKNNPTFDRDRFIRAVADVEHRLPVDRKGRMNDSPVCHCDGPPHPYDPAWCGEGKFS